jgi:hypothetical protein
MISMSELHPSHAKPEIIHKEKQGWETGPDSLRNQARLLKKEPAQ